ncbi:MAG: hypothetical protein AAFX81_17185 [Pseudomonadota bacterium]
MIPSVDSMARYAAGAWALLRNDESGMDAFRLDLRGLLQSFAAAVVVLPIYVAVVLVQTRAAAADDVTLDIWGRVLAFALQWAAFPLVAAVLAKVMNRSASFIPYVVAANWSAVVQIVIVLAVVLLSTLLPGTLGGVALLTLTAFLLFYDYRVVRIAFVAPGFDGVAVVTIQFLVSLLIQRVAG